MEQVTSFQVKHASYCSSLCIYVKINFWFLLGAYRYSNAVTNSRLEKRGAMEQVNSCKSTLKSLGVGSGNSQRTEGFPASSVEQTSFYDSGQQ